jgi:hypothetical protein
VKHKLLRGKILSQVRDEVLQIVIAAGSTEDDTSKRGSVGAAESNTAIAVYILIIHHRNSNKSAIGARRTDWLEDWIALLDRAVVSAFVRTRAHLLHSKRT